MSLIVAIGCALLSALTGAALALAWRAAIDRRRAGAPVPSAPVETATAMAAGPASDVVEDERLALAVIGIARPSEIRNRVGYERAALLMQTIAKFAIDGLPGAELGRIGRGIVEISFRPGDIDIDAALTTVSVAVAAYMARECPQCELDVAIGFAVEGVAGTDRGALIERAEQALGRARATKRPVAGLDPAEERHASRRDWIMRDLRGALARGEMYLCYQPKLRSRINKIDAVEALLRWHHPDHGLIPPDEFIPLAEASGEIGPITSWVLTRAIDDQARLAADGHTLTVHVNLSGRLVADAQFAEWALSICATAIGRIGFEVTETAVIEDPAGALRNLKAFSEAGIKIAIDDYGTGLSSLSYLKEMPADELKIDKLFVSALTTTNRDPLLVRSTIDLAHALEMEVTAEGVDTATGMALLRVMGCDLIQGYHISEPIRLDALRAFMDRQGKEDAAPATPMFAVPAKARRA